MKTKFVLLSNLLALLWACTMPVVAQYSFAFSLKSDGDDRPSGMLQQKDGSFVCYGSSSSWSNPSGQNYIVDLSSTGAINWEQSYNDQSQGDMLYDLIVFPNGNLLAGGCAQWQLQGVNPRMTLLRPEGKLLLDTLYKVTGEGGAIDRMVYDFTTASVVSLGVNGMNSLYFQVTDIFLKKRYSSYVKVPESFRMKKLFKHAAQPAYIVFGETQLIRLDSLGQQIGKEMMVTDVGKHQELFDVIQLDTGFVGILYEPFYNSYLQFYNQDGEMTTRVKLPLFSADGGYAVLNKTKDGGLVLLGTELLVLDAQLRTRFYQRFWEGDYYEWRSVAQASDGGFYGCALDNHKNDATDYDIFVFKTLPDGTVRTGITEQVAEQDMQVYPNPATHTLHLPQQVNIEQVKLCDITGRVVLQQASVVGHTLDVSSLQPGYYLLQLTTNKGTYAQRVCIGK